MATKRPKVAYEDEHGNCLHPSFGLVKVIDQLGPMLDAPDGNAYAQVLGWHWVCRTCGQAVTKLEKTTEEPK
jgi:hypothetical protein